MKLRIPVILFVLLTLIACGRSQSREPGSHEPPYSTQLIGTCEGCEAIFEYDDRALDAVDTLPDFDNSGTQIKVTGTIYQRDGRTPAEGVILYVYHTNQEGLYKAETDPKGWERRHGSIRGWMKTGKNGRYTFYTLRPGTYPDRSEPAHIHPIILEPDGKYYWLGSYFFHDDPLLTVDQLEPIRPRGGTSGVLALRERNGILTGQRDIVLGLNVE